MKTKQERQQEFNAGAVEALVIAVATLVRVLPKESKQAFMSSYPMNVETWDETGLFSSVTDEWLRGLNETGQMLHRVAGSPTPDDQTPT